MNKPKKQVVTQADKNRDKLKAARELQNYKMEMRIEGMSGDQILYELKQKKLPTFGTAQERKDRLKKSLGIEPTIEAYAEANPGVNAQMQYDQGPVPMQIAKNDKQNFQKKDKVVDQIENLRIKREERRKKMEEVKKVKLEREAVNEAAGKLVDVDFEAMIEKERNAVNKPVPHITAENMKILVCVRKRPLFKKEEAQGEIDCVTAANPKIWIHDAKKKVDGITKYIENYQFQFDNSFSHTEDSEDLYHYSIRPLIPSVFNKGIVTCFAYGQTGSGKTYTMKGVQESAIYDLFNIQNSHFSDGSVGFFVSFYEIYGGKLFDLLNNHAKLQVLEDKNNKIQIQGLEEKYVNSQDDLLNLIDYGHSLRTTHATTANDTSSRSHAICTISVKELRTGKNLGKLSLVDLAGSERAQDTQSNNRQRRLEGAEINKSLLALKECVRALDASKGNAATHVPFRASKLTMVLRDSFMSNSNRIRIVMIACIGPGSSSADHTLNTLRYAERLKENTSMESYNQIVKQQQNDPRSYNNQGVQGDPGRAVSNNNIPQPQQIQPQPQPQPQYIQPQNEKLRKAPTQGPSSNAKVDPKKPPLGLHNPGAAGPGKNGKGWGPNKINKGIDDVNMNDIPMRAGDVDSDTSDEIPSREEDDKVDEHTPNSLKNRAQEDWQYLKQTLNGGGKFVSKELVNFQEKADEILEEEEELINTHMNYIKEDAQLLTQEGVLVSNAQGVGAADYEIDDYVNNMEKIVQRKLQIYGELFEKLMLFKKHLREEEEASHHVTGAFYY